MNADGSRPRDDRTVGIEKNWPSFNSVALVLVLFGFEIDRIGSRVAA